MTHARMTHTHRRYTGGTRRMMPHAHRLTSALHVAEEKMDTGVVSIGGEGGGTRRRHGMVGDDSSCVAGAAVCVCAFVHACMHVRVCVIAQLWG